MFYTTAFLISTDPIEQGLSLAFIFLNIFGIIVGFLSIHVGLKEARLQHTQRKPESWSIRPLRTTSIGMILIFISNIVFSLLPENHLYSVLRVIFTLIGLVIVIYSLQLIYNARRKRG